MIYDAHAHLGTPQERQIRRGTPIISMICAQNPPEAQELEILCRQEAKNPSWLVPAYGLHPWQTGDYTVRDMEPFLSRASIIGEIGMDNVWCEVPLDRQQEAFEAQLALAHTAISRLFCIPKDRKQKSPGSFGAIPTAIWYTGTRIFMVWKRIWIRTAISPSARI